MRISLGTFACSCIEARFGGDVDAVVEAALDSYADRIESSAEERPIPLFWFVREAPEAQVELDLQIDFSRRRLFEAEALRQDVTVEQLLTHAIFLHIGAPAVHKTARIPVRI